MSCSSLYGIKDDFTGELLHEYENSWLFSPVVWSVLLDKYIPSEIETPWGYKKSIIGSDDIWRKTNNALNRSDNVPDRVCWEMSNQQIFFTKDKQFVANSIREFVSQNKGYDKKGEENLSPLEKEHIVSRFNKIADDILDLDETEYPYFVFKNTSVDDSVESWFAEHNEETDEYVKKSLTESSEWLADFVVIEGGKIEGWKSVRDLICESGRATDED